jgi:hypothetical protein
MSGILFVLAEILVFMVAATAIGFFLGKWLNSPGPTDVELVEEVERLEKELVDEVERLEAQLAESQRSADALQSKLSLSADAIRELEDEKASLVASHDNLEVALSEAGQPAVVLDAGGNEIASDEIVAAREAELTELRAEIERYRAELQAQPDRANAVAELEAALVSRDRRIERLEAQISAGTSDLPAPPAVSVSEPAADYGFSTGVGDIADSQIDFEITGQ